MSSPKHKNSKEMFVPDMTLSNDFGDSYLQKSSKPNATSPKKSLGKSFKVIKTHSPYQQPLKIHTNSEASMLAVPSGP